MSDESNKQVELAAATAEPPTPHPLSGDVLPVDLPGRMQLTHYSPESDRAFAYARDKLSKAYREASTAVFFAAAEFDEPDGVLRPEVIEAMERSCDALDRIAAEAEQLKVPRSPGGPRVEMRGVLDLAWRPGRRDANSARSREGPS